MTVMVLSTSFMPNAFFLGGIFGLESGSAGVQHYLALLCRNEEVRGGARRCNEVVHHNMNFPTGVMAVRVLGDRGTPSAEGLQDFTHSAPLRRKSFLR